MHIQTCNAHLSADVQHTAIAENDLRAGRMNRRFVCDEAQIRA